MPHLPAIEVSTEGRVRGFVSKRIWTLQAKCDGRLQVVVRTGKHRKGYRVHDLVLRTFVGPPPAGHECRHLNDECQDNRLANLAWGTKAENLADKIRNGKTNKGSKNPNVRLDASLVAYIRSRPGVTVRALALETGVSKSAVHDVRSGRTWGWLDGLPAA